MRFRRRQVLGAAGALSLTGLAGCSSLGGQFGSDGSDLKAQTAAVDRFITAVNENDLPTVEESVSGWAAGGFTADNIDEYSLERGDLTEKTDGENASGPGEGRIFLKTRLSITHAGETRTAETNFGLSMSRDEEWRVTSIHVTSGNAFIVNGTVLAAPAAIFDDSYDADATDSDDTGMFTVAHNGGSALPAAETRIAGTVVDPPGADPDVTSETTLDEALDADRLAPGDSVTVGVEHDYNVSVHYSKRNLDSVLILGRFSRS